jgi:hypothetical protein
VCEVVEVLFKYLDLVRAPGGINEQVGQSGLAGCMNDRKGARPQHPPAGARGGG